MMRLARTASLVVLLLVLPAVVRAAFEKCSWGSPWTNATRNTYSTRTECEGVTRAVMQDFVELHAWGICRCRSTDASALSLSVAVIFATVMSVKPLFRSALAPRRHVTSKIFLVVGTLILGVVVLLMLTTIVLVAWST